MKLWERTLFSRLSRTAFLILGGLFGVYILADLSVHSVRFFSNDKAGFGSILLYYSHCLSLHLELFIAIAFLLALLRVLFEMNQHGESTSLRMAGLSLSRLSRPMFLLASLFTLASYANAQWVAPYAIDSIDQFRNEIAKRKKGVRDKVHALTLQDGSEIVYQRFDLASKTLFDSFWIRNNQELWHIKRLDLNQTPILGHFVDVFKRNESGTFELIQSFSKTKLDLLLSKEAALQKFIPYDERPLWTLMKNSLRKNAEQNGCCAHLHYKLTLPLLPVLIALVIPPILLQFSRNKRQFLIAACSLFGLISFLTLLDGMLILAENRVLNPWMALWTPWLFCAAIAIQRRRKSLLVYSAE